MSDGSALSVDDLLDLLATGADRPLVDGASVSQLDHALQTAALLGGTSPSDPALAAAGLVHDIGHLMDGVDDDAHAPVCAAAVRGVLGDRVADLVGLHVEAKRYLVASEAGYGAVLGADSATSLGLQGGAMTAGEAQAFTRLTLAAAAVTLRRADDRAKVEGLVVEELTAWAPLLHGLAGAPGAAAG